MELKNLEIGKEYIICSRQFKSVNKVIFLSHDLTPLNRKIGYFMFSDRGYTIPKDNILKNPNVFAVWQWQLDNYETRIIQII